MSMVIANTEMAKAWDGDEGDQWTDDADRYDASGARIWGKFLAADLIRPADRVLDVGCGTGQSTRDAARAASSGSVLGVDLSSRMLGLAEERTKTEGLSNVSYIRGDAQVHPFEAGAFDLAISRFGVMFFADAAAAFANIASALHSGGRLATLAWSGIEQNPWLVAFRTALAAGRDLPVPPTGAPGPFALADPDGVRTLLESAGFADVQSVEVRESLYFGRDADDAWEFVKRMGIVIGLTESLDEDARNAALAELRKVVDAHATGDGVLMGAGAWITTARRV